MDPVIVVPVAIAIIGALGSGTALVVSTRTNTTALTTQTLVTAQQATIKRLDKQLSDREDDVTDLREKWDKCREDSVELEIKVRRLSDEVISLRQRVTEIGDERIP